MRIPHLHDLFDLGQDQLVNDVVADECGKYRIPGLKEMDSVIG
jgi:hypothetical protein